MNYNPIDLIEKTGLKLDTKNIALLQKENRVQPITSSNVYEIAHLFTNPESYFFRSFSHLKLIKTISTERISIWFAGCSTGQEVYSASLMLSSVKNKKLVGTDLSKRFIDKALSGSFFVFKQTEIDSLKEYKESNQFELSTNKNSSSVDIYFNSEKNQEISFDVHNLMDGPYGMGFDVVFCRNVLLHMTLEGKEKALRCLKQSVKVGGILILGDTDPHIFEDNWDRKKHENVIFWTKMW